MAPKLRVYNLARELNLDNAEIIRELQHMGVPVTSHSNTVDDRQAALLRKKFAVVAEAPKAVPEVVEAKPAKAEPVVEHVEPAPHVEVKAEPKIEVKPEPPAPTPSAIGCLLRSRAGWRTCARRAYRISACSWSAT